MKGHKNEWFTSSGASEHNIKDSSDKSGAARCGGTTYPTYILQQVAMICQIVLGVAVITVSVMGLIQPLWLSTALTMFASVTILAGAGFLYLSASKKYDPNALLRHAMRRVMESRN